jgi:hypothetical protein
LAGEITGSFITGANYAARKTADSTKIVTIAKPSRTIA